MTVWRTFNGSDDVVPVSFAHLVAGEKGLSVWHDARGADNDITAVCLSIGELDVNRPRPPCRRVRARGFQKEDGLKDVPEEHGADLSQTRLFALGNRAALLR